MVKVYMSGMLELICYQEYERLSTNTSIRSTKYEGEFREFNISVFQDQGIFLDLVHNMPTDMWQSALGTVTCMGIICYIFMYDPLTVLATTSVITSIMTCNFWLEFFHYN